MRFLPVLAILVIAACERSPEEKIVGTWKSAPMGTFTFAADRTYSDDKGITGTWELLDHQLHIVGTAADGAAVDRTFSQCFNVYASRMAIGAYVKSDGTEGINGRFTRFTRDDAGKETRRTIETRSGWTYSIYDETSGESVEVEYGYFTMKSGSAIIEPEGGAKSYMLDHMLLGPCLVPKDGWVTKAK